MPELIEVVTFVDAAPAVVFDLELDVDVHSASLPGTSRLRGAETATTSSGQRQLGVGDDVTFRARHFGLKWRLTSRITVHERPHRFVDEQVRGPFAVLRHEHRFDAVDVNRTRMTDRMLITAPGGGAGAILARVVLVPYLRRLLRERGAHIKRTAEAAESSP
ncbi:MAG: SRPBCC family protein [Janthinobacterium lividum]